jgi:hypothetical protein
VGFLRANEVDEAKNSPNRQIIVFCFNLLKTKKECLAGWIKKMYKQFDAFTNSQLGLMIESKISMPKLEWCNP